MAKGRVRNRLELRANIEAAERRERGEDERDEDEEEEEETEAGAATEEAEAEEGEEEEVAAPKKKKAPAKTPKPRTRAPKHVRLKMVWKVFNNSHQPVATFDYPRRKDAEEHAARLAADKKSTFFVQPVKEPMEEKKE
jgi:hypothetical protein